MEHEDDQALASGDAGADARALLQKLDASDHLKRHGELVEETAFVLVEAVTRLGISLDREFVRSGALLHDIGKVAVPEELAEAGCRHQVAGEHILRDNGVDAALARVCRTHAEWNDPDCTLEELLIALADKLWKGKRVADLEILVVDRVASRLAKERFDVYPHLDSVFESVSAGGQQNLERSLERPGF